MLFVSEIKMIFEIGYDEDEFDVKKFNKDGKWLDNEETFINQIMWFDRWKEDEEWDFSVLESYGFDFSRWDKIKKILDDNDVMYVMGDVSIECDCHFYIVISDDIDFREGDIEEKLRKI